MIPNSDNYSDNFDLEQNLSVRWFSWTYDCEVCVFGIQIPSLIFWTVLENEGKMPPPPVTFFQKVLSK